MAATTSSKIGYWSGVVDLYQGLLAWRRWHLIGTQGLRNRYARSSLGQMWIVLSQAISIGAYGLVWGMLWRMPYETYVPYVGFSSILWLFFTSVVMESTTAFAACQPFFLNQRLPYSFAILATLYRNFLIFLHHVPILMIIMLIFGLPFTSESTWAFAGLALGMVWVLCLGIIVGTVCARYRDMIQVVATLFQVAFFLTPIMWFPEMIPDDARGIVEFNPFGAMLSVVRDPLLGRAVQPHAWELLIGGAIVLMLLAPMAMMIVRRRVIYWL